MSASDDLLLLARAVGGLVVVLGLVVVSARLARRSRGAHGSGGLRIVDRVGLSRDAQLAVVAVADRTLLLGITPQGVSLLAALDGSPSPGRTPEPMGDGESSLPAPEAGTAVVAGEIPAPRPVPIPAQVPVGEYPDLASALRAAGRSADARPAPRTRAEARARSAAQEQKQPRTPPTGAIPRPRAGAEPAAGATRRIVLDRRRTARTPPVAGSVLSPRTWKQGIEALRDLTVRRG